MGGFCGRSTHWPCQQGSRIEKRGEKFFEKSMNFIHGCAQSLPREILRRGGKFGLGVEGRLNVGEAGGVGNDGDRGHVS